MTLVREMYELENKLKVAKENVTTLENQLNAVKEKLDNSELRKFAKQFKKELLENLDDSDIAYFVYERQYSKEVWEISKNEISKIYVSKGKLFMCINLRYTFNKNNNSITSFTNFKLVQSHNIFHPSSKDVRLIRVTSPEIITKVDNIIAPINSKTIKKL